LELDRKNYQSCGKEWSEVYARLGPSGCEGWSDPDLDVDEVPPTTATASTDKSLTDVLADRDTLRLRVERLQLEVDRLAKTVNDDAREITQLKQAEDRLIQECTELRDQLHRLHAAVRDRCRMLHQFNTLMDEISATLTQHVRATE